MLREEPVATALFNDAEKEEGEHEEADADDNHSASLFHENAVDHASAFHIANFWISDAVANLGHVQVIYHERHSVIGQHAMEGD